MSLLDPSPDPTNELLERLPARDRKQVLAACQPIEVELGQEIYQQDARIKYAYFPLDSMFSELTPSSDPPVEAFLTGREGMMGYMLALGASTAAMQCSVQGSGRALRMKAADFVAATESMPSVHKIATVSAYFQVQQMARNLYCVRHHDLSERLARWLLMAMDRHQSRRFDVTHKFLAAMLGSRRAGVTVAARNLSLRRLIRYRRGEMEILDRAGLEKASCGCYDFSREAHEKAFRA
jgi:CRP-like cAMP-binding protein